MPKVIVNEREIEVPGGTSVMDAIFHAGYDVPLFCAERYLSPIGACRMCLVRMGTPRKDKDGELIKEESGAVKIFWMPKLNASCTAVVSEGMAIDTLSDAVRKSQSGMVELTLMNHPLDCPTCDKGGACELQDRSYEYGLERKFYSAGDSGQPLYTRYEFTRRQVDKHHPLSEFITLDRERCIHCKRCVRYFEEIPGQPVLDFIERGVDTFIGTADYGLPSNFTGNITDICPVGALLDGVARFRGRNWEYDHQVTTDLTDASGSGIMVDSRGGQIERIRAFERREVNQAWISDAARFGHGWVRQDRLTTPLIREGGRLVPASWDQAFVALQEGLAGVEPQEIGLYLSGASSLEEGYAAARLASKLATPYLDFEARGALSAGSFLPASFSELLGADLVLVAGNPTEELPILHIWLQQFLKGLQLPAVFDHGTAFADLNIKERMPRQKAKLALFSSSPTPLGEVAGIYRLIAPGSEAEFLAGLAGKTKDAELTELASRWKQSQNKVLVLGAGVLGDKAAAGAALKLAEGAKVIAMTPAANARGLELAGVWPGSTTGQPSAALYSGWAPSSEQLEHTKFQIFHQSHLTPEAEQHADIVLPAETSYEKFGTMVNAEGRFLPLRPVGINNGESEGLVGVLAVLEQALGLKPEFRLVRQIQRALKTELNLDLENLDPQGERPVWTIAKREGASHQGDGPVYLRPSMWRFYQLSDERVRAALGAEILEAHPETLAKFGLQPGQNLELELPAPLGRLSVMVSARSELAPGALHLPAYGFATATRLPLQILQPAGEG